MPNLKGFGVSQDQDLGIELLRASAKQGNEEAIELLVEFGLEVIPKESEENKNPENQVVKIHEDLAVRARSLLAKTTEETTKVLDDSEGSKVISFAVARQQRIEQLMTSDDENPTD